MNTPKTRLTLLGITAGILLALLLAPQTRWLPRLSFIALSVLPGRDNSARQRVAQAHPNDLQIQMAGRRADTEQTPLDYDRSLVARFPQSPSLRAAILREATTKEVRLHRDEDNLLEGKAPSLFQPGPNDPASSLAQLADFEADAAAGEKLDPDNAYFPFMRAVGLFASHRDADGVAAIERASQKRVWHEYFEDPVEGAWRINDAIYGGREALADGAISAALLFPHYEQLRHAARVMVYKAVLDEQAGHSEPGLTKRLALAQCGELMQGQATTIIGNLVGNAVCATSRVRPGGAAASQLDPHLSNIQKAQIRLDAYCAYVTKIGHPEAALQARADARDWQQLHSIFAEIDTHLLGVGMTRLVQTAVGFFACLVLLPSILGVFLLGAIAAGLSRLPQIRERRPLPAGTATGFWSIMLLGVLLAAAFYLEPGQGQWRLTAALAVLVPLAIVGVAALALPRLRPRLRAGLTAAGVTLAIAAVFGVLSSWQASALAYLAFGFALPALLVLIWSIVGLVKHVPFAVKVVENFQAVMPPLICALMLVYGGVTLWTVQQEARANYGLERSLRGEGQYLAEVTGQAWPKQ